MPEPIEIDVITTYDGAGIDAAKADIASLSGMGGAFTAGGPGVGGAPGGAPGGPGAGETMMGTGASDLSQQMGLVPLSQDLATTGQAFTDLYRQVIPIQEVMGGFQRIVTEIQPPIQDFGRLLETTAMPAGLLTEGIGRSVEQIGAFQDAATQLTSGGGPFLMLPDAATNFERIQAAVANTTPELGIVAQSLIPESTVTVTEETASNLERIQSAVQDTYPLLPQWAAGLQQAGTSDFQTAMGGQAAPPPGPQKFTAPKTPASPGNVWSWDDGTKTWQEIPIQTSFAQASMRYGGGEPLPPEGEVMQGLRTPGWSAEATAPVAAEEAAAAGAAGGMGGFGGMGMYGMLWPMMLAYMVPMMGQQIGTAVMGGATAYETQQGQIPGTSGTATGAMDSFIATIQKAGNSFSEGVLQGIAPSVNGWNQQMQGGTNSLQGGQGVGQFLGAIGNFLQMGGVLGDPIAGIKGFIDQMASMGGLPQPFQGPPPPSPIQQTVSQMRQQTQALQQEAASPDYLQAQAQQTQAQQQLQQAQWQYDTAHGIGQWPGMTEVGPGPGGVGGVYVATPGMQQVYPSQYPGWQVVGPGAAMGQGIYTRPPQYGIDITPQGTGGVIPPPSYGSYTEPGPLSGLWQGMQGLWNAPGFMGTNMSIPGMLGGIGNWFQGLWNAPGFMGTNMSIPGMLGGIGNWFQQEFTPHGESMSGLQDTSLGISGTGINFSGVKTQIASAIQAGLSDLNNISVPMTGLNLTGIASMVQSTITSGLSQLQNISVPMTSMNLSGVVSMVQQTVSQGLAQLQNISIPMTGGLNLQGVVSAVQQTISSALAGLGDLGSVIGSIPHMNLSGITSMIQGMLGEALSGLSNINIPFTNVSLGGVAATIGNAIAQAMSQISNINIPFTNVSLGGLASQIQSWLSNALSGLLSGIHLPSSFAGLPMFASGVENLPSSTLAVVGEEGPELLALPGGSSVYPMTQGKMLSPAAPGGGSGGGIGFGGSPQAANIAIHLDSNMLFAAMGIPLSQSVRLYNGDRSW